MLIVRTQTGACLSPAGRRKACIQREDRAIGRSLRDRSTSSGGSREGAIFGLYQRPGIASILTVEEKRLQHCASARRDLNHVTRNPPQMPSLAETNRVLLTAADGRSAILWKLLPSTSTENRCEPAWP